MGERLITAGNARGFSDACEGGRRRQAKEGRRKKRDGLEDVGCDVVEGVGREKFEAERK
jgi:hypothetical protein